MVVTRYLKEPIEFSFIFPIALKFFQENVYLKVLQKEVQLAEISILVTRQIEIPYLLYRPTIRLSLSKTVSGDRQSSIDFKSNDRLIFVRFQSLIQSQSPKYAQREPIAHTLETFIVIIKRNDPTQRHQDGTREGCCIRKTSGVAGETRQ